VRSAADAAVKVTVRYFAAARAAAGFDDEIIAVAPGTTVGALVHTLGDRDPELAKVLSRCSYLCDGIAVRNLGMTLGDAQTVDVLPPFAGG
jgi:molybdopterin synthase sulfur carrier subunit